MSNRSFEQKSWQASVGHVLLRYVVAPLLILPIANYCVLGLLALAGSPAARMHVLPQAYRSHLVILPIFALVLGFFAWLNHGKSNRTLRAALLTVAFVFLFVFVLCAVEARSGPNESYVANLMRSVSRHVPYWVGSMGVSTTLTLVVLYSWLIPEYPTGGSKQRSDDATVGELSGTPKS